MENKYNQVELSGQIFNEVDIGVEKNEKELVAVFKYESDAKEYCEFKNRKKITRQIKVKILEDLEINLEFSFEPHKKFWIDAIEIIKNLAEEQ